MAKTILRASARHPRHPVPIPPKPVPVREELDTLFHDFGEALCVLHCILRTINIADDTTQSEDLSRANLAGFQTLENLDRIYNRLDSLSLRISHEGIPPTPRPSKAQLRAICGEGRSHG